jgi:23S rRNA pseudouridine1911/1915/1917 synthase
MNSELPVEVLFEDNHILVLNKASGMLTQPSGTDQSSLEAAAKQWLKEKYQKPGNVFLEAVHRLDKGVSGVVLFAKTSKALSRLNEAMRSKHSHKVYLAYVEGHLPQDQGTLEHYLVHDSYQSTISHEKHPQAKFARLHYRLIRKEDKFSVVEITLETGRYHQIRAQFAAFGFPIMGDVKYGSKTVWNGKGIALHHRQLTIPHPITGSLMTFEAPLPKEWD